MDYNIFISYTPLLVLREYSPSTPVDGAVALPSGLGEVAVLGVLLDPVYCKKLSQMKLKNQTNVLLVVSCRPLVPPGTHQHCSGNLE